MYYYNQNDTHLSIMRKKETLICDDDLGDEGMFYSCHEHRGGCGSTFRITPNGECLDIL